MILNYTSFSTTRIQLISAISTRSIDSTRGIKRPFSRCEQRRANDDDILTSHYTSEKLPTCILAPFSRKIVKEPATSPLAAACCISKYQLLLQFLVSLHKKIEHTTCNAALSTPIVKAISSTYLSTTACFPK